MFSLGSRRRVRWIDQTFTTIATLNLSPNFGSERIARQESPQLSALPIPEQG
jgi:hypothetical protein